MPAWPCHVQRGEKESLFATLSVCPGGAQVSKDGLPKLPVTSVAIVVGVGSLILEAAGHAPILSTFMPRVLTCAACLALAGWALDKRESTTTA